MTHVTFTRRCTCLFAMCAAKCPTSATSALRSRSAVHNDRGVGLRRQRRERETEDESIASLEDEIESFSSSPPQAKRVCGRQRHDHTRVNSGAREALIRRDDVNEADESSHDQAIRSPINQTVGANDAEEEEMYTNYEEDVKTITRPFRLLDDAILLNPAKSPDLDFNSLLKSAKAAHARLSSLEQKLPDLVILRCRYSIPNHDGVWLHDEAMSEAQYEELKRCDWQYTLPTSAFGMFSAVFAWLDDFVYEVITDVRLALFYLFTERIKSTRFLLEAHERFKGDGQTPVEAESTLSDDIEDASSDASSYSLSQEEPRQPDNGDDIDEIESFESDSHSVVSQQPLQNDEIDDDTRSNATAHSMDTQLEDDICSNSASSSSSSSSRSALV